MEWLISFIGQLFKKRKYKKFITYYRNNPDKFCEDYLGIKLFDYQKEIIKNYANDKNKNIKQKPIINCDGYYPQCPNCYYFDLEKYAEECSECGQPLDWSFLDKV